MDADTAIGGPRDRFPSTQVSLLQAVSGGALAADAMERIAALYWKPVYRFVRVKLRLSNEDAKDLTQSFFASAIERDFFQRFDASRASFRTYLMMAVERFAANEYAAATRLKRGGGVAFEPVDETAVETEAPDQIFEREWRRQVFALAIEDLHAECERSGKQDHWAVFAAYDLAENARPTYASMAAQYSVPETQITNHLAWARRTLRTLVQERLRGVTSGTRELNDEMRRLWN